MINKRAVGIISTICAASLFLGFVSNEYFRINKSFDIFGNMFKEILNNYVLEIEPEELFKSGVEGMLNSLDPYAEYFDESNSEEFEIISNGAYTGFGFTVGLHDSTMTITGINDGNSAQKAGIRIGDKIYSIDSTIVYKMDIDKLRDYTKGKPGTKAKMRVIRQGVLDTLEFILARENVALQNVPYSGIVKDNIAYVKLDRFTQNSAVDLKNAILNLKRQTNIKGIVLDLRGNPGGLLASAVSICEMFLPKGSLVVTTKGRDSRNFYEYRTFNEPLEPKLPLAVIIDEESASASEVVAGAIQDYDRGVIIGRKSFGKGLVQSVFELPYNTALKLTTAKYYTPSGRCIQKIKYQKGERKAITTSNDTTVFFTKNGRKVYESAGITPDSILPVREISNFVEELYFTGYIFNFANQYTGKLNSLSENFKADDKLFNEFETFLVSSGYKAKTTSRSKFEDMSKLAKERKYNAKALKALNEAQKQFEIEEKNELKNNKKDLLEILEIEILARFKTTKEMLKYSIHRDKTVEIASKLLTGEKYSTLLTVKPVLKNN